tara:strand:+ start:128 stop:808 length:681 start_codon:yes stop_codon:yes gene_type:complete
VDEITPLWPILERIALDTSAAYVRDNVGSGLILPRKEELWDYSLAQTKPDGLYVEFGVHSGTTINYFAQFLAGDTRVEWFQCDWQPVEGLKIFGFDSFQGLKEDWSGTPVLKNTFDRGGELPTVRPNVILIKGWFDETVQEWLDNNPKPLSFVHFDADTYESTILVLNLLKDRIRSGTIIVFDEYLCWWNWDSGGEFRAWQEFCSENQVQYRYLVFTGPQAAVQIL